MHSTKFVLIPLLGLASALLPGSRAEAQTAVPFNYTGALQSFTVPANVSVLTVKLWGAGGGGVNALGGGGGFTSGNLAVTAGEQFSILVGGAGSISSVTSAFGGGGVSATSGGGGRTGIRLLNGTDDLADAGGGGGGGVGNNGGAGGGVSGIAGNPIGLGGGGGTQSAGGGGGAGGAQAGSQYQGGGGTVGGGGGGYFGGGGGNNAVSGSFFAAGGGGSGFGGSLTGAVMLAGSGATPANTGDSDYLLGIGTGGSESNGGNGYAVLSYTASSPATTPEPGAWAMLVGLGVTGAGMLRRRRARKAA